MVELTGVRDRVCGIGDTCGGVRRWPQRDLIKSGHAGSLRALQQLRRRLGDGDSIATELLG